MPVSGLGGWYLIVQQEDPSFCVPNFSLKYDGKQSELAWVDTEETEVQTGRGCFRDMGGSGSIKIDHPTSYPWPVAV